MRPLHFGDINVILIFHITTPIRYIDPQYSYIYIVVDSKEQDRFETCRKFQPTSMDAAFLYADLRKAKVG
jgi:hypothetical protein